MQAIAQLLFEARMLKAVARTGYQFLGAGRESVAEHVFQVTFIGWVLSRMEPGVDPLRLIGMCLLHDLPEAKIGDLNTVQKRFVRADEARSMAETAAPLPFGGEMTDLLDEFNAGETPEARLARDADQLALLVDLKHLLDRGYRPPEKWLPHVLERLQTATGRTLARQIAATDSDSWWLDNCVDSPPGTK